MVEQELVDVEWVKSTGTVLLQHLEAWMLHQSSLLAHFHTLLAVSNSKIKKSRTTLNYYPTHMCRRK